MAGGDYNRAWQQGWEAGWKQVRGGFAPYPPYPPYPQFGQDDCRSGFAAGVLAGAEAAEEGR